MLVKIIKTGLGRCQGHARGYGEARSLALTFCSQLGPNYFSMHLCLERVISDTSQGCGPAQPMRGTGLGPSVQSDHEMVSLAGSLLSEEMWGQMSGLSLGDLILHVAVNPTRFQMSPEFISAARTCPQTPHPAIQTSPLGWPVGLVNPPGPSTARPVSGSSSSSSQRCGALGDSFL